MPKAYFIDSAKKQITETEIGSWEDIAPKIGCELFTTVGLEKRDTLYVDDEGLLTMTEETPFFMYQGYPQPLAGNGIVMGTDAEGESVAPKMSIETLRSKIHFMDYWDAYEWSKNH